MKKMDEHTYGPNGFEDVVVFETSVSIESGKYRLWASKCGCVFGAREDYAGTDSYLKQFGYWTKEHGASLGVWPNHGQDPISSQEAEAFEKAVREVQTAE